MRTIRSVAIACLLGVSVSSLSGCELFAGAAHVMVDVAKAQNELVKTFGVQATIKLDAPDLESARVAKVQLARHPAGLTELQVERDVNIVLHKFVPRIEKVEVTYSAP
jgi:Zn-dependent alcohol dehydrogenase